MAESVPGAWPELAVPVSALPGVGPARGRLLAAAGLPTVERLLRHLPHGCEDRSHPVPLREIRSPGVYTAVATVRAVRERRPRPGLLLLQASLVGEGGALPAAWFNQGYLRRLLVPGARLRLHGRVALDPTGRLSFQGPEVEPLPAAGADPAAEGLLPLYPAVAGIPARTLRRVVQGAAHTYAPLIPDTLPADLRARLGLPPAAAAWHDVHVPTAAADWEAARRAIVLEEIFHLQVGLLLRRRARAGARRPPGPVPSGDLLRRFLERLPFSPTAAQVRVLGEIDADLAGPRPMYRLVQGDVGCGKTVVAAAAMLRAVESGRQAALLAPTEVLARQHLAGLRRLYGPLCRVEGLSGATPRAERTRLLLDLAAGRIPVLVGTHALLQPDVRFAALGMAVTDELHRFGVRQRDALAAKGSACDVLVLSATPIPRTLALTLYGDLDVSVIDQLPPGRRPVRTYARTPDRRQAVYAFVRQQIAAGGQAYVVCPLIADPTAGAEEDAAEEASPAAAESFAARLATEMPEVAVGLLHGRMSQAAKDEVMDRFARGEIRLLVATTVVEVGLDVPAAAVMVVEDADRFGLAQLHQLRGRVGRGTRDSYCILIARGGTARLEILTRTSDGFAIAEEDLRQRGPGEVLGSRQHGLPELALADPRRDGPLLSEARRAAAALLTADPDLRGAEHAALRRSVEALFGRPRG